MVERLAAKGARYLTEELKLTGEQETVLVYALKVLLSSVIGYLVVILFAWILGILPYTLAAAMTASVLRTFSGGAHANSPLNCTLIGVVIFTELGLLSKYSFGLVEIYLPVLVLVVWFLTLLIIRRYVPADTPEKPIENELQRRRLRRVSTTLVLLWGLLMLFSALEIFSLSKPIVYSSTLGLVWQVFSLTPAGYAFAQLLNVLLDRCAGFYKDKIVKM